MPYLELDFPPGLYNNGTERQSKGRWHVANLVRWYEGTTRPIGGWRTRSTTAVTGKGRRIITWRDNSSVSWSAIATESHLYAMGLSGVLHDITPSGFVSGIADAIAGGGYGTGNYGDGTYGTPRADSTQIQDATVASLETFGEDLLFCTADDGKIYEWTLNTSVVAAAVSGAPTARALHVTDERFLFALGAAGVPRRVQWADQESLTVWTPADTNQAGSFDLQSVGKLMCGARIRGGSLLFTDYELFLVVYIGGVFVYSFQKVADGCGVVAQGGVANFNGNAVWMGRSGFWLYNGFAQALPCDVQDYVFTDINYQQISKVSAHVNATFGEITWQYPSGSSVENDSYVTWSYREFERGRSVWSFGKIGRTSGCDKAGAFQYPLEVGTDGYVYDHEVGLSYADHGAAAVVPYLESGPVENAIGDFVLYARQYVPDQNTIGDVSLTFKTKFYPDGDESSFGPYTASAVTDVRFCGRQVRLRYDGAEMADWRVGSPRLEVVQGGRR